MFTLADVYCAYRKAKYTAFRDTNCSNGIKFVEFETNLEANCARLLDAVNSDSTDWPSALANLGRWTFIPKKGLDDGRSEHALIRANPLEEWTARWAATKTPSVEFRNVFDASADFQTLSALWCITAGAKYDQTLDRNHIYGSRLRRVGKRINRNCAPLFGMYQFAYGAWQRNGLRRIRTALNDGDSIVAITMDLRQFYHQVDVGFALDATFLNSTPTIRLRQHELRLTQLIVRSVETANKAGGYELGLPVGMSFSTVLANALLRAFDRAIIEGATPVYYGRYIDDVFLAVKPGRDFSTSDEFADWLVKRCGPVVQKGKEGLSLSIPGARGSQLSFGATKQKIFQLQGEHGLDLIEPISFRLREQASAIRSLPIIPQEEGRLATNVLRLSSNASLEINGLRKADAISLRRAEFATLLGQADAYSRDLSASQWKDVRDTIFQLAKRHLFEPSGFFELSRYIPRVFRIAARCNSKPELRELVLAAKRLKKCLDDTVGNSDAAAAAKLHACWETLGLAVLEAVVSSVGSNTEAAQFAELLEPAWGSPRVRWINQWQGLFEADWADQGYARHWISGATLSSGGESTVPSEIPSDWGWQEVLGLAATCHLSIPNWRAVLFPTRNAPASLIAATLSRAGATANARTLSALRAAWYDRALTPRAKHIPGSDIETISIASRHGSAKNVRFIVANSMVELTQWRHAVLGSPEETRSRYESLNRILNQIMDDHVRWSRHAPPIPTFLVFPELCLPQKWWPGIVRRLGRLGINLVAGLEYRRAGTKGLVNEVLIALENKHLPSDLYVFCQGKRAPAWEEEVELRRLLGGIGLARSERPRLLFEHGRFSFAALICNELTDIDARAALRGRVDAVIVPEWNRDVGSFSTLVESSSLDIHAFVIQANNRAYGDSRVRSPARQEWLRDVVRVKGGVEDHYVTADLPVGALRIFQTSAEPAIGEDVDFKPFPTGFSISPNRRTP